MKIITLLEFFKPHRALLHVILCSPPMEGLLEVGMFYSLFVLFYFIFFVVCLLARRPRPFAARGAH